jgi:hypothetical protein
MNKLFIKMLLVLPLLLIHLEISICQDVKSFTQNGSKLLHNDARKKIKMIEPKEGHITSYMVTRDWEDQIRDIDLTEEVEIIVEFKEEPFFIQEKRSRELDGALNKSTNSFFYQSRFDRLANDLNQIDQNVRSFNKSISGSSMIKSKFYKTFFGASITVPWGALNQIQELNYVKKIHRNKRMRICLNESVTLIRADSVRNRYGTDGDSIIVGILDTGIDYNHPALGGGFGPGFKVIGGYDVFNQDDDPMDDHSHGTHVAGIIAADGEQIRV